MDIKRGATYINWGANGIKRGGYGYQRGREQKTKRIQWFMEAQPNDVHTAPHYAAESRSRQTRQEACEAHAMS